MATPTPTDAVTGPNSSVVIAWILLIIAGLLEIGWAIGLKYTQGFTRPLATVLTLAALCASFVLLAQAVRVLPIGTAYAAWTGIGAAGAAILGMILFKEPATLPRLACVALIILGVLGLKLLTPVDVPTPPTPTTPTAPPSAPTSAPTPETPNDSR